MNSAKICTDFPVLKNNSIVYLDSAASSLTPEPVLQEISDYYRNYSANVYRGLYPLSQKATQKYEEARKIVAQFINAQSEKEIIFTRNTTESINLIAYSWGRLNIGKKDEIVTSIMEHHSNFVPWQVLCQETGATLKIIKLSSNGFLSIVDKNGNISFSHLQRIITPYTKLVALTHVSNVLGTINQVKKITSMIKKINTSCLVLIDGAQAVPHMKVDVQDIGCDFYAFSGHKMLGPTGIGVLWIHKNLLDRIVPFQFGGGMISRVELERTIYKESPEKFEAGTPHIAGAIGLGKAISYLSSIGMETIEEHEKKLTSYLIQRLTSLPFVMLYGPRNMRNKASVVSFNLFTKDKKIIHPHDVGDILGNKNICVRVGHHCAMPLGSFLRTPATIRASLYLYNTRKDIDRLIQGLHEVMKIFS